MAWCKRLWAPVPKALAGLLLLWRVMWVALTCYKVCWEAAFHLLEEVTAPIRASGSSAPPLRRCPSSLLRTKREGRLGSRCPASLWSAPHGRGAQVEGGGIRGCSRLAGDSWGPLFPTPGLSCSQACFSLTLWLEGGDEASQGNGPSSPHLRPSDPLWPKQAGTEELEEKVQAVQEPSGAVLGRLAALEAGVQYLSQELRAEKLLWSSRYLDLLREQQDLLVQVQRRDALWLKDVEGQSATGGADGNWPEEPAGSSIQRCRPGLPDWRRRLHARATQSKPHQASWHGGGEAGTATLG